jgi:hypothetical protein
MLIVSCARAGDTHNYQTFTQAAGGNFYGYAAKRSTPGDLAAGLTGEVFAEFRGCDTDTCGAVVMTHGGPNVTVLIFSKTTDLIAYHVKGAGGEKLGEGLLHGEPGSVMTLIRDDAVAGKLKQDE